MRPMPRVSLFRVQRNTFAGVYYGGRSSTCVKTTLFQPGPRMSLMGRSELLMGGVGAVPFFFRSVNNLFAVPEGSWEGNDQDGQSLIRVIKSVLIYHLMADDS